MGLELSSKIVRAMSGDDNPIHTTRQPPIVHGMLIGAYVSRLVGTRLPGAGALMHSCRLDFLQPVFAGDTIVVDGTVTHRAR